MNLAVGLEMVTQTHPGKIRTHNEDALYAVAALGLAILADGMGATGRVKWPVGWRSARWRLILPA